MIFDISAKGEPGSKVLLEDDDDKEYARKLIRRHASLMRGSLETDRRSKRVQLYIIMHVWQFKCFPKDVKWGPANVGRVINSNNIS